MRDEETIALLREIRDLLVAQRELLISHEDKYQKYLDDARQDYADHVRQSEWSHWKTALGGYLALFLILAFGVFVGVLFGVRMSKPWQ